MAGSKSIWRAQELVTYPCSLCDIKENVNWFCNDCQEALCDRCKELHTRGKKTKNDDVVTIGKANRQDAKPVPEACKLHPGKLCHGYCCDCDMLVCSICLSQTHKHHDWKHMEDEFTLKKQHLKEHMTTIYAEITHFKNKKSTLQSAKKESFENIDGMRKEANSKRAKLEDEVDHIADTTLEELSALEKEQLAQCDEVCQQFEKKIEELTRLLEKAQVSNTSSVSMFDLERSLRSYLPLDDVNVGKILQEHPNFVTGSIDRHLLRKMFDELLLPNQYKKIDINSNHVQRLSNFTITQQTTIFGLCPVDENHAWLSIHEYKGLVLVNRDGVVTEEVDLYFCPCRITAIETTDVLMTSNPRSTSVYKLSLHNKQVTTFADISPRQAWDISINKTGMVFVSTETPVIVVLNQTGIIIRKFSCGKETPRYISCLSSGRLSVMVGDHGSGNIIVTYELGTAIHRWFGELNNGEKTCDMTLRKLSRDRFDRLFIPDYSNNQVYVLPNDKKQAKCLLDQKHEVVGPTVVSVDTFGHVWIGCWDGTVHVMRL
ncbi:uncharacterized protein LOC132561406 [Ylistrum balloti]|uniref:uncharacterized protein LOC132561406 n=1 Tax=Ylistrum balloti TaxID=509963 RepID=UPI0029058021|nr:uncharacterized protein LOC132561406 [Ylistrum balloti]